MVETGGLENRWPVTGPGGSNPSSSANLLRLTEDDARGALERVLCRLDLLSFEAVRSSCRALRAALGPAAIGRQLARLPPPSPLPDGAPVAVALGREVAVERGLREGSFSRFVQCFAALDAAAFAGDDRFLIGASVAGQLTMVRANLTHLGDWTYGRPEPAPAQPDALQAQLGLRLSDDGRWLFWLPAQKRDQRPPPASLVDLASPTPRHTPVGQASAAAPEVMFSPSSAHLALSLTGAARDRCMWDLRGARPVPMAQMSAMGAARGPAAFCPDGAYFAAAGEGGEAHLWPMIPGQRGPVSLQGGLDQPVALAISRQAEKLVALDARQAHIWWQPLGPTCEGRRVDLPAPGPAAGARSLAFPGRLLLSSQQGGTDPLSASQWLAELRGHHVRWQRLGAPACRHFSVWSAPSPAAPWQGGWLLVAGADGDVHALDLGLPEVRALRLPGLRAPLAQAALTGRGGDILLLALSHDAGASLWRLPAGAASAARLAAPAWGDDVSAVAWLPRPGWAATGHRDGRIMLWPPDAAGGLWPAGGGAGVARPCVLPAAVDSLQVSRGGTWLYAGSAAGPDGRPPEGRIYRLGRGVAGAEPGRRAAPAAAPPPAPSAAGGSPPAGG